MYTTPQITTLCGIRSDMTQRGNSLEATFRTATATLQRILFVIINISHSTALHLMINTIQSRNNDHIQQLSDPLKVIRYFANLQVSQ